MTRLIRSNFLILAVGLYGLACSKDEPTKELRMPVDAPASGDASEADSVVVSESGNSVECGAPGLNLAEESADLGNTFHSLTIQGVLRFCGGCHAGEGTDANLDFGNYDRMLASFTRRQIGLQRIYQQVLANHQDSRPNAETIAVWAANSYARGVPPGGADESPFFDRKDDDEEADEVVDLDAFDPFKRESVMIKKTEDDRDVEAASANCP